MLSKKSLRPGSPVAALMALAVLSAVIFLMKSMRSIGTVENASKAGSPIVSKSSKSDSFLYFAYASDLLESRLKAGGGPSAHLLGKAVVKGFKFAFSQESKVWRGGVADIVPADDEEVWGAVYRLRSSDLISLNKQKGVDKIDPLYEKINVVVDMDGERLQAITYSIVDIKRLPFGAAPSPQYKECLIRGAEELGLPSTYIDLIRQVKDNGSTYRRKNTC